MAEGCPNVGDATYAGEREKGGVVPRMMLHAEMLEIPLLGDAEGERSRFEMEDGLEAFMESVTRSFPGLRETTEGKDEGDSVAA
mmetsp:Transcript_24659/g.61613  ORF Transcript_24659/g.61613 Transcript_24659/m.61613 type:complete len:84 (+) Transcript_24659:1-252(+)